MNKNIIKEMVTAKAEENNTVDLDAYALGLTEMFDRLLPNYDVETFYYVIDLDVNDDNIGDCIKSVAVYEIDHNRIGLLFERDLKLEDITEDKLTEYLTSKGHENFKLEML